MFAIRRVANNALLATNLKLVRASSLYAYRRNQLLAHHAVDLVLDVGANIGQFGTELRRHGYRKEILSFEPLSSAYSQLQVEAKKDPCWRTLPLAVGDTTGVLSLHVAKNSESSSLLEMNQNHLDAAPYAAYCSVEDVRVTRLDELWGTEISAGKTIFMKLDTQGYEAHAIRGAGSVLDSVALIECEMSLVPLYDGEKLFPDMYAVITELGFDAVGFDPVFYNEQTGQCMQVDVLFARAHRSH